MKKIILLILMLVCITGCNKKDNISDITFTNIVDCNHKPILLTSYDDINVYTYCIEDIKVNINNKSIDLKKYINKNKSAIENITEFLSIKTYDTYDLTIFNHKKFEIYKENVIKLIKCHTLDGNNDVYVGNSDMNYKINFCKDNNYTFIRTYFVEELEYDSFGAYNINLKSYDGAVESVIVSSWKLKYIEKNKTYEFEFMLNDGVKSIEDNTKSIFDNSTIVDIRETTKDIKNQINEKWFIK